MDTLCKEAIRRYGPAPQVNMAVEECAELIVALRHFDRNRREVASVASEIADVVIMCEQMALLVGDEAVASEIVRKLDRLEQRMRPSFDANGAPL